MYIIEDWGCGYWPLWHDGNRDGRHGLPRLIKEIIDLLAFPDRTKNWGDQRALPVDSEQLSPISRAILLNSIAVFIRSEAAMPSAALLWDNHEEGLDTRTPQSVAPNEDPGLGLRDLLHQLPTAAIRSVTNRWANRQQIQSS
jgi:hypothetical protein